LSDAGPPLVRFGLIADPQYAPHPPMWDRFYANSLGKLEAAIAALNAEALDFVVTLGDLIDRDWASFDDVLPLYDRLTHPHRFVLGNHDFEVAPERVNEVPARLGIATRHHDFAHGGVRFIVVDGTDLSLYGNRPGTPSHARAEAMLGKLHAAGAANAQPWNGGLSDAQLAWLGARLDAAAAAGERVIVLGHFPIHPPDRHNLWNAEALLALLAERPCVLAYINGHNHDGHYGRFGRLHCVTLEGMVETASQTAFAVASLYSDRLELRGTGRLTSRTLPFD
jgi:3',5'-cyclic AMP phosphodiesterase CpdA